MLSRKHRYYTQVQGQLLVADLQFSDFVCWTTEGMFIETITMDSCFNKKLINKANSFFCKYLLPELITHHFKEGKLTTQATCINSQDGPYCFCKQDKPGLMIACDNPSCQIEWFHYDCVGVRRKPKGDWFCPECKSH